MSPTRLVSRLLSKATTAYREDGGVELTKQTVAYLAGRPVAWYDRFVRPHLPRQDATYNEVTVRAGRRGDTLVPWHSLDVPGYEGALVRGIRRHVTDGDAVVVVGGGWGVSTVAAARQAGSSGTVTTYEGATDIAAQVEETARLNDVGERVTVRNAVVARAVSLRGEDEGDVVDPGDLPACDVLVLDCEGAETEIIREMTIDPDVVVVETHAVFGAPKQAVRAALVDRGYTVTDHGVAETQSREFCEDNGIYVLTARRDDGAS